MERSIYPDFHNSRFICKGRGGVPVEVRYITNFTFPHTNFHTSAVGNVITQDKFPHFHTSKVGNLITQDTFLHFQTFAVRNLSIQDTFPYFHISTLVHLITQDIFAYFHISTFLQLVTYLFKIHICIFQNFHISTLPHFHSWQLKYSRHIYIFPYFLNSTL